MKKANKIILGENWGVFLGAFENNIDHQHYAVQINIPLFDAIVVTAANVENASSSTTIIPSNLKHKIHSDHPFLLILINPLDFINVEATIAAFKHPSVSGLQKIALSYCNGETSSKAFETSIRKYLSELLADIQPNIDNRISKALEYLNAHKDRVVCLSEIANYCCLSESRFLHLFKSELKITYRRAQLWYRISQSFESLFKSNITETAYEFGFADSAHYSRTFKENFGFSPRELLKNSQFIQV